LSEYELAVGTNNYSQLQILISQTKRVKSFYNLHHYSLRFEIRK